jgi:hypothetical protein
MKRHGLSVVGRRRCEVRRRFARFVGRERAGHRRFVLVAVRRRRVALRVGRTRVLAHPGLDLRPGQDGSADHVVDDRGLAAQAAPFGDELVASGMQARDEPLVASVRSRRELARHVPAVERDLDRAGADAARKAYDHQRFATGDQIGPIGQHPHRQCSGSLRAAGPQGRECCQGGDADQHLLPHKSSRSLNGRPRRPLQAGPARPARSEE